MENKVYYGEYSLKHWINLMVEGNIGLPAYQRHFVWGENQVSTLMETFTNKEFVPPVTIGAFKIPNQNAIQNLIIDGQQRLTSILLAYLAVYPDKEKYPKQYEKFINENDDEETVDEEIDIIFEWTFEKLKMYGKNEKSIREKISAISLYKKMEIKLAPDFFETTFLGFSYLVPAIDDGKKQQKYYSSVFRNINIQGVDLLVQESRASLYFLNNELAPFFQPDWVKKYVIGSARMDFVRYLSLLSEYKKNNKADSIARGYKPKMEKYYEDYIYSVVADKNDKYGQFSKIIPDAKFMMQLLQKLEKTVENLNIGNFFQSIIELDMFFFGLIYLIIFENKTIYLNKSEELKKEIQDKITSYKQDRAHAKAPSNFSYLRERITSSIEIYAKYAS